MPRPRSDDTDKAVKLVMSGVSPKLAAERYKIDQRTIYRDPVYRAWVGINPLPKRKAKP